MVRLGFRAEYGVSRDVSLVVNELIGQNFGSELNKPILLQFFLLKKTTKKRRATVPLQELDSASSYKVDLPSSV